MVAGIGHRIRTMAINGQGGALERAGYRVIDRRRRAGTNGAAATAGFGGFGGYGSSGFDGANSSPLRGYVYFPTLDTRTEANRYTRMQLLKKARWLYANNGFTRRCINGAAGLVVGRGLMPFAATEDTEWNDEVGRRFMELAKSSAVFDVSGKYTFARAQLALVRNLFRDGDVFPVLTESESGLARIVIYEGHQIGTGNDAEAENSGRWFDGVRVNSVNRAVAYRILTPEGERARDLPAEDICQVMNDERIGAKRGITALYHAVNNLLDRIEIQSFLKQGVKIANELGFVIKSKAETPAGLGMTYGRPRTMRATNGAGEEGNVLVEDIYRGGGKIADPGSDREIELLESSKPHPNEIAFLDYLARDISWGLGVAPELLWNIERLGGANTRFILDAAQIFVEEHQQLLVDQFLQRFWIYFVAKELKRGLRQPSGSKPWWEHGWMPPARRTVDYGRDGNLHLKQHEKGMRTLKRHYEELGLEWRAQVDQDLDERIYRFTKMREKALAAGLSDDEARALLGTMGGIAPEANAAEETAAQAEKEETNDDEEDGEETK